MLKKIIIFSLLTFITQIKPAEQKRSAELIPSSGAFTVVATNSDNVEKSIEEKIKSLMLKIFETDLSSLNIHQIEILLNQIVVIKNSIKPSNNFRTLLKDIYHCLVPFQNLSTDESRMRAIVEKSKLHILEINQILI